MKILFLVLTLGLVSCGEQDGAGATGPQGPAGVDGQVYASFADKVADFNENNNWAVSDWYGPGTRTAYFVVKGLTALDNIIIYQKNIIAADGSINATSNYVIDLTNYDVTTHTGDVFIESASRVNTDLFLIDSANTGHESFVGVYLSEENPTSKDLESLGAKIETEEASEMEEMLLNYGLSTARSEKLSKLMVSYQKIKAKRALTAYEKDIFTKELTGLTFKNASSVLVNEGHDSLVEKASLVNGIDPEAIKEILNQIM